MKWIESLRASIMCFSMYIEVKVSPPANHPSSQPASQQQQQQQQER